MQIRHLGPADFNVMPWQNARGMTTELCRENDAAGQLIWRLSEADVKEDGPFSAFPGLDRILMLLRGEGFDLDFGDHGRAEVTEPLVPVAFSGDWLTLAANVRGPSVDLNLMLARGKASAEISVVRGAISAPLTDRSLFLAIDSKFSVALASSVHGLEPGELLFVSDAAGAPATTEGAGVLVRVEITFKV